jgi:hypothetical protein
MPLVLTDLKLERLTGRYDDGWCSRLVSGTILPLRSSAGLYICAEIPTGLGEGDFAPLSLTIDSGLSGITEISKMATAYRIAVSQPVHPGLSFGIRIFCTNRLNHAEHDKRELSFHLLEIGLI